MEDCPASDWDCLCAKYQTVLTYVPIHLPGTRSTSPSPTPRQGNISTNHTPPKTRCYNNCPDHEGRFGAQSQVTANCNAAKSYGTSTSAASKPTEASATTNGKGRGTGSGGSGGDEEEEEGTATESGEAETSTGAASGPLVVEAGGLFAAVLVGLGAWL